jgi:hypothetical protein
MNVQDRFEDATKTGRAVRTSTELSHVTLVGVLDTPASTVASGLASAGFDAVLVKPVSYVDIERFLVA